MSERQTKETARARAAFEIYLGLGPGRSLTAVAEKAGVTLRSVQGWSWRYRWRERVLEQSNAVADVTLQASKEVAKQEAELWNERQELQRNEEWRMREELMELAREAKQRWLEEGKAPTLDSIAKLLEVSSKLGRLASGLGTDRTEVTGLDGDAIRVELLAALHKVYGEPKPVEVESTPVPTLPES